ncbi:bifunctional DNA-binding transcriptional regulator/O6-methylguanine-DNA methyltransferase Ada [Gloeocapsopsis dulcis]|uniref:methylated-DNA--[protein]-cysteine S-methyltransferase n=1 Tax=Gloeocapsopsis dulcis AAB1 = 1H9 TaxID=1433147 RepID=A0A6N8FXA6_9CHRO|nr:bifunctional DNA-binding transcriptional regulator/O6-methylguanine-DNA methyltransferase Ada [Gloeocapsopsis dulcis]MUL37758.1 bifunctional transcriptional regulator/O6-methylguanine-DNA methyltransferase [Gloeocapsopsis dulcis AAB1 = 1H9]WNN90622.1 bifunctional DNA-binding transcriptional regulator/O6-methylguanine-DNA methyltransferase Ada [Gloeocapsopsis dulcis]
MMKSAQLDFAEEIWQAVVSRDSKFDGKIFYGVHSTKIYCRPSCPSRKPNRSQVTIFQSAQAAELQGFRPCKRCQPHAIAPTINKILTACRYIEAQSDRVPTLTELSTQVAMSPTHFQRVFKQIVGVTPFEYGNAQRRERLKQHLHQGVKITDALYEVGYGSSSRLYEQAPEQLGMTPARYKQHGRGEEIRYTSANSPLGYLTIAATKRGICSVKLGDDLAKLENELHNEFCHASLHRADEELQEWTQALINYLSGKLSLSELPYDVKATAFQIQVWEALKQIPFGTTVSYSDVACSIGHPTAIRAVARACATNPIALIIPCHRVLPKAGGLGGYRWGVSRKQALLEMEQL